MNIDTNPAAYADTAQMSLPDSGGPDTDAVDQATTIALGTARAVLLKAIRTIDTELEAIEAPSRTELARQRFGAHEHVETLRERVRGRLAELRQPAMDYHFALQAQRPKFGLLDLASLGMVHAVRRLAASGPIRRAADAVERQRELYRLDEGGYPYQADGRMAQNLYRDYAAQDRARYDEVARYELLSGQHARYLAASKVAGGCTRDDLLEVQGNDAESVTQALEVQGQGLVTRARMRVWIEALQRTGTHPRLPTVDPGGRTGEPMSRLLEDELRELPHVEPGVFDLVAQMPRLIKAYSEPGVAVKSCMDAIVALRGHGLTSEQIIAGAAVSAVCDIAPGELAVLYVETQERHAEEDTPRAMAR